MNAFLVNKANEEFSEYDKIHKFDEWKSIDVFKFGYALGCIYGINLATKQALNALKEKFKEGLNGKEL